MEESPGHKFAAAIKSQNACMAKNRSVGQRTLLAKPDSKLEEVCILACDLCEMQALSCE